VAIPFGAFEAVLQDEVNADVSVEFVKLAGFGGTADANLSNLQSIRGVIERLRAPESVRNQLREAFQKEGMDASKGQGVADQHLEFEAAKCSQWVLGYPNVRCRVGL
jgi:hypothetical protein